MTSSNRNNPTLLARCEGNPPVTGGFPSQRPITRSFDVFFDLHRTKGSANSRNIGDLERHRAHYDVIVINWGTYVSIFDKIDHYGYVLNEFIHVI